MTTAKLHVVCGLPGVGKTTFAEELAEEHDAKHIRTDELRKEWRDDPKYTDTETNAIYALLRANAWQELNEGRPVVVDGTFRVAKHRDAMRSLAAQRSVPVIFHKVECNEDEVRERLEARNGDASDADFSVYDNMEFEPIDGPKTVVDTTQ